MTYECKLEHRDGIRNVLRHADLEKGWEEWQQSKCRHPPFSTGILFVVLALPKMLSSVARNVARASNRRVRSVHTSRTVRDAPVRSAVSSANDTAIACGKANTSCLLLCSAYDGSFPARLTVKGFLVFPVCATSQPTFSHGFRVSHWNMLFVASENIFANFLNEFLCCLTDCSHFSSPQRPAITTFSEDENMLRDTVARFAKEKIGSSFGQFAPQSRAATNSLRKTALQLPLSARWTRSRRWIPQLLRAASSRV
jgi:hypothetical protein